MNTQRRWLAAVLTESAKPRLPPLPWQRGYRLSARDRQARIAALLRQIPRHAVPRRASRG